MENGKTHHDEFYVGYLPKAPTSYRRLIKSFLIVVGISLPILALLMVINQKGFRGSSFELGQLTEREGILIMDPVPMLKVDAGKDHMGNSLYQSILLIGFGKYEAEVAIKKMEEEQGQSLEGKLVTLEGTLIYYDGKALMELTKMENALKAVGGDGSWQSKIQNYGESNLVGEILDSKCYFGVMRPGEGKPHRSCAIRCLSGGLPAVLRLSNESSNQYLIVLGEDGEKINDQLFEFVGDAVELQGEVEQIDDWLILKLPKNKKIKRLSKLMLDLPMCQSKKLAYAD